MKPGKHDWVAYSGATFSELIQWHEPDGTPVDLNLYVGLMEIRDNAGELLLALSNTNNRIQPQLDGGARLFISDDDTRAMAVGNYRYDILFERISDEQVFPLLEGRFRVNGLVTRSEP